MSEAKSAILEAAAALAHAACKQLRDGTIADAEYKERMAEIQEWALRSLLAA